MTRLFIILFVVLLSSCEKESTRSLSGTWNGSNDDTELIIEVFQSGSLVAGTGYLTISDPEHIFGINDHWSHDIQVSGSCSYPDLQLVFTAEGTSMQTIHFIAVFDNHSTIQGLFSIYDNNFITLKRQ